MVLWGLGLVTLSGGLLASSSASFAANPQSWVEDRTTHFVVVSNANERDARRVALQFEMVRTVFQENLGHVPPDDQPVIIIAAADEATLNPHLPESRTKKGAAHRAGVLPE
jgi:hypothetical protein